MSNLAAPAEPISRLSRLDRAAIASASSAQCGDLLGDLRRVRGWIDALEARVTSQMDELYRSAGQAPASDQHTRRGRVSAAEARRKERRARTLDQAEGFESALANGTIGAEHVDALANATQSLDTDQTDHLLAGQDDLLAQATSMSPERFARHVRGRVRDLERDQGVERNNRQRRDTYLSRRTNLHTGMIEGRFAFHPELADQVFSAVDREVAATIADRERSGDPAATSRTLNRNQLAAEALGRLVAGGHQQARPLEADITVVVDAATLTSGELRGDSICETNDGLDLPPSSAARLLCNAVVTPIIVDGDGRLLDAGRTVRTANRHQRRALRSRYRTCAIGTCDVAFTRCEIHHIHEWEHGGHTDIDNLIPLCSRHHHLVHELRWRLHLAPDRTLTITEPDGTEHAPAPPDMVTQQPCDHSRRRPSAA